MSNPRISSILLYIVAVISLLVILFFYAGPRLVSDYAELEARYEEVTTGGDMQVTDPEPVVDTTEADTTAAEGEMTEGEPAGGEVSDAETAESGMEEADTAMIAPAVAEEPPVEEAEVAGIIDLKDHFSSWELMVLNRTDYALVWAYILLVLTAFAAVVFPLINIVTNVKALIRTLALLAGAAVLILLAYFVMASDTPIEILGYAGTDNRDPATLKWVGTGLFSTYILFGLAILSILYSEIAGLFK